VPVPLEKIRGHGGCMLRNVCSDGIKGIGATTKVCVRRQ